MEIQTDLNTLLEEYGNNQSKVAGMLQCSRSTLAKLRFINGYIVLDDGRIFRDTEKKIQMDPEGY